MIGRNRVMVSHLQLADDTIFFFSGDEAKFQNLKKIVEVFGIISSFKVKMEKSGVVGITISQDKMNRLAFELGVKGH